MTFGKDTKSDFFGGWGVTDKLQGHSMGFYMGRERLDTTLTPTRTSGDIPLRSRAQPGALAHACNHSTLGG